jgi:hypothetical protein
MRLGPKIVRWEECLRRLPPGPCTMAEVGVWQGGTCSRLLASHPELYMHLVDPWQQAEPGSSYANSGSINANKPHELARMKCLKRIASFAGRFTVHRMESTEAAPLVADASLDLVFIDADHSYDGVSTDIDAWLAKVKPSGWIGGHDYGAKPNGREFPGVQRAVDERFDIIEPGGDSTWWHRVVA